MNSQILKHNYSIKTSSESTLNSSESQKQPNSTVAESSAFFHIADEFVNDHNKNNHNLNLIEENNSNEIHDELWYMKDLKEKYNLLIAENVTDYVYDDDLNSALSSEQWQTIIERFSSSKKLDGWLVLLRTCNINTSDKVLILHNLINNNNLSSSGKERMLNTIKDILRTCEDSKTISEIELKCPNFVVNTLSPAITSANDLKILSKFPVDLKTLTQIFKLSNISLIKDIQVALKKI